MTHAAVLKTEQPELQAAFSMDWSSGKYRRPKCSKADYYAGWLAAYERFVKVAQIEKIAAVPPPPTTTTTTPIEPEQEPVTGWTPALSQYWLEGVMFGDPRSESGHRRIYASYGDKVWRLSEYNSGEWTMERKDPNAKHAYLSWDDLEGYKELPLKTARIVIAREMKGLSAPEKTVTRYEGGLPLKHSAPKGPAPFDGSNETQAIPDSLLRKLAIKAGRPAIAP